MRVFFFSSRRRHTRCSRDWSSDVCSSDLFRRVRVQLESMKESRFCLAVVLGLIEDCTQTQIRSCGLSVEGSGPLQGGLGVLPVLLLQIGRSEKSVRQREALMESDGLAEMRNAGIQFVFSQGTFAFLKLPARMFWNARSEE